MSNHEHMIVLSTYQIKCQLLQFQQNMTPSKRLQEISDIRPTPDKTEVDITIHSICSTSEHTIYE